MLFGATTNDATNQHHSVHYISPLYLQHITFFIPITYHISITTYS
jgi:hypothetical protein